MLKINVGCQRILADLGKCWFIEVQSNLVRKSLFTTSTSLQQHTWQAQIQWSLYYVNVLVITTTWLYITAHFSGTEGVVVNKFDCT